MKQSSSFSTASDYIESGLITEEHALSKQGQELNDRPVIAILATPEHNKKQTIPSSYVKFVESSGARVLPVFLNQSDSYYQKVIKQTNGLLFTGGSQILSRQSEHKFIANARSLWNEAIKTNQDGHYYPIIGICLGMELMTILAHNRGSWVWEECSWENYAGKLNFTVKPDQSKIFKNTYSKVLQTLQTKKATFHNHQFCLPIKTLISSGLGKFFNVIATNSREDGSHTVTILESKEFPFYSVLFHPERVIFEQFNFESVSNTPHFYEAVMANRHFANFFVRESRKSSNQYPDDSKSSMNLISSKCPVYTHPNTTHSQIYYFPLE
ncbi:gamma-glutamyl hydrolase B-like [Brevipalpus obovatus]|uniref:gamma-glutamyl hydrolase B-like n=1 Tax=Brevipalpus obovatus TaxID=246614 RepID=UPI003D9EE066